MSSQALDRAVPRLHLCCGRDCPGLPWRPSALPHPSTCLGVGPSFDERHLAFGERSESAVTP